MKLHVVTEANREYYSAALEQMHRQRHFYFVEEMGWKDLYSADGLEVDEYDDAYAVYLLAMEGEKVEGSLRLLPTWRRSLLIDHFSHFVTEGAPPQGPNIWEWTRWAPGSLSRPKALVRSRKLLILSALEFARSRGVDTYTAICDMKFLGQMIELGWWPTPLGLPRAFAEGTACAMRWEISPETLDNTRVVLRHHHTAGIEAPAFSKLDMRGERNATEFVAAFAGLQATGSAPPPRSNTRTPEPELAAIDLNTIAIQGNA